MRLLIVVILLFISIASASGDVWRDESGAKWHYYIDAGGVVLGRRLPERIPGTDIRVDDYITAVVCFSPGANPLKFNFTSVEGTGKPVLNVPCFIAGLPVRKIDKVAFCCLSGVKKIVLPEGLESIGFGAFAGSSLEEVEIPDGVSEIGEYLFSNCINLSRVRLPTCVKTVRGCFINNCTVLRSVEIPNGVQRLDGKFKGCLSLTNVKIPSTLEEIADNVFNECCSLESIDVEEGNAFFYSVDGMLCSKISREILCVPWKNRTRILKIPDGACSQENHGKFKNRSVEKIVIPKSMNSVATSWLKSFPNVRCIEVERGNESYKVEGNVLYDAKCENVLYSPQRSNHSIVRLPCGIKSICDYAFGACVNLEEIDLPCGIVKIGKSAFARTGLTRVKMPKSMLSIEPLAFDRCYNLSRVDFDSPVLFVSEAGNVKLGFESSKEDEAVCEVDDSSFSDCSKALLFNVRGKTYYLQDLFLRSGGAAPCDTVDELLGAGGSPPCDEEF